MKKILFVCAVVLALVLSLTGCRTARPAETAAPAAEPQETEAPQETAAPQQTGTAEDGQNPVMNFVGAYHAEGNLEALVEADGTENAKITITRAASPWFHTETVMSGPFDPETLTMEFSNAAVTEYTYKSDGSVDTETVREETGTGRAVFSLEDNTVTVAEEYPSGSFEIVYAWGPSDELLYVTAPDHYAAVTSMDKAEIETVIGFNARKAYLSQDWFALADMVRYPITINGTELADSEAFLGYMMDKTVDESDRNAMNEEDLLDMFVNGQGICMGTGQIWFSDPNYMTDGEPKLEIIAISGIVSEEAEADSQDGDGVNTEEDFYDHPSVTAYDEEGNAFTLYESSDGYWREEDGTTYVKLSDTEFQRYEGTKRLTVR